MYSKNCIDIFELMINYLNLYLSYSMVCLQHKENCLHTVLSQNVVQNGAVVLHVARGTLGHGWCHREQGGGHRCGTRRGLLRLNRGD